MRKTTVFQGEGCKWIKCRFRESINWSGRSFFRHDLAVINGETMWTSVSSIIIKGFHRSVATFYWRPLHPMSPITRLIPHPYILRSKVRLSTLRACFSWSVRLAFDSGNYRRTPYLIHWHLFRLPWHLLRLPWHSLTWSKNFGRVSSYTFPYLKLLFYFEAARSVNFSFSFFSNFTLLFAPLNRKWGEKWTRNERENAVRIVSK